MYRKTVAFGLLAGALLFANGSDVQADAQWAPVRDRDLRVVPGSALDFSQIFGKPAKIESALGIGKAGRLSSLGEKSNDEGPFLCASMLYTGPHGLFPDHKQADELARQLRLHGYNLARFHYVDATLMRGSDKDFDYDRTQVDRFHYLLAALKRNGIRWMIDAATSRNGAYGGVGPNRFKKIHNLKADLYYDPKVQAHWLGMVDHMLAVKNPYTGLPILKDPALLSVTLVNEGGVRFTFRRGFSKKLRQRYRGWLRERGLDRPELRNPEVWERSPAGTEMNRFITELEADTAAWMTAHLRKRGYRGLITSFNNGKALQNWASRSGMELVTIHNYHDHPSNYMRKGSTQHGDSSIAAGLPMLGYFATSRYLGRPMIVEEYDHPYWSEWRRETGLAMSAYAAFQGWSGICRFTNPVELEYDASGPPRSRAIHPFGVGMDPIARTGETLAALLFRRGDVREGDKTLGLKVSRQTMLEAGTTLRLQKLYGGIGFVTRTGVLADDAVTADATLDVSTDDLTGVAAKMRTALGRLGGVNTWFVDDLRDKGLLSGTNASGGSGGVLQSTSGELTLEPDKRRLTVVTPRTEAAVFDRELPRGLKTLRILSSSVPALFAASSLDERPLADSNRMLLILATDAVNSGAKFAKGRRELVELGHLPVLLRTVRLEARIMHSQPGRLRLYALGLNGERREEIPVSVAENSARFRIDTASLKGGPTTYFELAAAPAH